MYMNKVKLNALNIKNLVTLFVEEAGEFKAIIATEDISKKDFRRIKQFKQHIKHLIAGIDSLPEELEAALLNIDEFNPDDNIWEPYKSVRKVSAPIPTMSDEEILNIKKKNLLIRLTKEYGTKVKKGRDVIADTMIDPSVIREYEIKERKALEAVASEDYSFFDAAATAYGVTSEELVTLIIAKATEYHVKEDKLFLFIGTYRSEIESLINIDDVENAELKLNEFTSTQVEQYFI